MKNFTKLYFIVAIIFTVEIFSIAPTSSINVYASTNIVVEPRADIIEWRYKTENGKLYRRKFNYSKNEWVGDWQFVGNVS